MFKKLKNQVQETISEKLKPLTTTTTNVQSDTSIRSRRSSISSLNSEANNSSVVLPAYTTPPRKHYPPSDVESEFEQEHTLSIPSTSTTGDSLQAKKHDRLEGLLEIYKSKYKQLKDAYDESESEKEKIKIVLGESQDRALKRIKEFKERIDLEMKIKQDLESDNKRLQAQRDNLIKQLSTTSVNSSITSQTEDTEEVAQLKDKLKRLESLLNKCKEVLKTQKDEIIDLKGDNEKLLDKLKQLEESSNDQLTKDLKKKIDDLNSELKEKDSFYKDQITIIRNELISKEDSIERSNEEKIRFNQLMSTVELEKKNLANSFETKLRELESINDNLQLNNSKLNDTKENQLNDLQSKYNELENKFESEKNSNNQALKIEIQNIKNQLEQLKLENEALNTLKNDLEKQVCELKDESMKHLTQIDLIINEKQELETRLSVFEKEINRLKSEPYQMNAVSRNIDKPCITVNKESVELAFQELKNEEQILLSLQTENKDLYQKIEQLTAEIANKIKQIDELNSENSNLEIDIERQAENYREEIKKLHDTININENNSNSLKIDLENLRESLNTTRNEMEARYNQVRKEVNDEKEKALNDLRGQLTEREQTLLSKYEILKREHIELKNKYQDISNTLENDKNEALKYFEESQRELEAKKLHNELLESLKVTNESLIAELNQKLATKDDYLLENQNAMQTKLVELEKEKSDLSQQLEMVKNGLKTSTEAFESLKLTIKSNKLEMNLGDVNEALNKLSVVESNLLDSEKRNLILVESQKKLQEKVSQLEQELNTKLESMRDLNKNLNEFKEKLNEEKQVFNLQIQNSQNDYEIFVQRVNGEIENLKNVYESTSEKLKQECETMTRLIRLIQSSLELDDDQVYSSDVFLGKIHGLKTQITILTDKLNTAVGQNEANLKEVKVLTGKLNETEQINTQLISLKDEIVEKSNIIKENEQKLKQINEENQELKNKFLKSSEDNTKNTQLLDKLKKLKAQLEKAKLFEDKIKASECEKNDLSARLASIAQEYENIKLIEVEYQQLKCEQANCLDKIKKLEDEKIKLHDEKIQSDSEITQLSNENAQIKARIRAYDEDFIILQQEKETITKKLNDLTERESQLYQKHQNQIAILENDNNILKESCEKRLNALECELNAKNDLVSKLEETIENIKQEHTKEVHKLNIKLDKSEKNAATIQHKAELKLASLKKHFENDSTGKLDEINRQNSQLEHKLKENSIILENAREENSNLKAQLSELKSHYEGKLRDVKMNGDKQAQFKQEQYEELLKLQKESMQIEIDKLKTELDDLSQERDSQKQTTLLPLKLSTTLETKSNEFQLVVLKKENESLSKEIEELKMVLDNLVDEKARLNATISELKEPAELTDKLKQVQRRLDERERHIKVLEAKNEELRILQKVKFNQHDESKIPRSPKHSVTLDMSNFDSSLSSNLSNVTLEPTEVDYLRQIIYAYMMGIDPITMAKVIVAILKFSDNECRRVLEHEKEKVTTWFPKQK